MELKFNSFLNQNKYPLGEKRVLWKESISGYENLSDDVKNDIENRVSKVPENKKDETKKQLAELMAKNNSAKESQSTRGNNVEKIDTKLDFPTSEEFERNPQVARQKLEIATDTIQQNYGFVDRGPIARNMLRSAATTGGIAFVPSYLAYLSHFNGGMSALSGGVGAFIGWHAGKMIPKMPKAGRYIGAGVGTMAPPYLLSWLKSAGEALSINTGTAVGSAASVTLGTLGGLAGFWCGGKIADKIAKAIGKPKASELGKFTGGVITGGAGYTVLSGLPFFPALGPGMIQPSMNALGGILKTSAGTLLNYFPASNTIPMALQQTLPGVGFVAGTGALLYGLGRLHTKLWGGEKAGVWKNMARGILGVGSIPAWFAIKPLKMIKNDVSKTLRRIPEGAKNIYTGKSKLVNRVAWPIYGPPRALIYRPIASLINGITGKTPPEKLNPIQKAINYTPHLAGKIVRSPWDALKWLFTPQD